MENINELILSLLRRPSLLRYNPEKDKITNTTTAYTPDGIEITFHLEKLDDPSGIEVVEVKYWITTDKDKESGMSVKVIRYNREYELLVDDILLSVFQNN